jgi:uncharacterized protein (TIGR02246 family)
MVAIETSNFASADQAESEFYRAIQANDLPAMMAVWSDEDDIVCIHPQGPRLEGHEQIRESWTQILQNSPPIRFRLTGQRRIDGDSIAIRYVNENIYIADDQEPQFTIHATNVYRRTSKGWRIILHHASPTPETLLNLQQRQSEDEDTDVDVTVH